MYQIEKTECLSCLLDQMDLSIMLIGRDDGIIQRANLTVCKNTGKQYGELLGQHYRQVFWPEFITVYDRLQQKCVDGKEHTSIYYWGEMAMWEQISARIVRWRGTPCMLMTITNISDVARMEYRLENIAYFDNVLKLPNGAKLEEDINDLASFETVAIIYFDIERSGEINALYGWDNGDSILKQIRDYLLFSESNRAQLYRINNGFGIFGRKVSLDDAKKRAEEILRRFDRPWVITAGGNSISRYCSIRLCVVYGKYVKNEMRNILLKTVNSADHGNTSYTIYDEEADKQTTRSLQLRDSLINCIYNKMQGFDVHYHPVVDVHTERWMALEALCRWTAPSSEKVSPLEFIHAAEQLNLIDKVDSWVRKTAMNECRSLRLDEKDFLLDVNFSPTLKIDDAFIKNLLNTLNKTDFPPSKLNLEITESAKMVFDEHNLNGLKKLTETGIILSLDDFGTGYSSFANLIHISAKALKTEKLFLNNIVTDSYRQYLLKMLIELAHYHKMHFIAEGVETREQLDLLRKMGVDYAQGFLFAKPMPYEQLCNETSRFDIA